MRAAINHLGELLEAGSAGKLSNAESRRYLRRAHFNRACYRAVIGDEQLALDDVRASKTIAQANGDLEDWRTSLGRDLAPGGQLTSLTARFPLEVEQLKS